MEVFRSFKALTLKAALPEFPAVCERAILKSSDLTMENGKQLLFVKY
jgi:hypothetical protein